jgi:hypothetical protein
MQTATIMSNRDGGGTREELLVTSGNTNQRRLGVDAGEYAEWNWRELSEHSVDAAVVFVREGARRGDEVDVRAWLRRKMDAQSFTATEAGELVFMFDNTASWITDKRINLEIKKRTTRGATVGSHRPPLSASAPALAMGSSSALGQLTGVLSAPLCPGDTSSSATAADLLASPGARDDEAVQRLLAAEAEWAEKHTPHLPAEPPEPHSGGV